MATITDAELRLNWDTLVAERDALRAEVAKVKAERDEARASLAEASVKLAEPREKMAELSLSQWNRRHLWSVEAKILG